jgi:hypothetical protein
VRYAKPTRKRSSTQRVIASDPYRELRTSKLRLGDPAYAFELPRIDVERRAAAEVVRLADHLGRRPVVLVFGSYTCARFRRIYGRVESLARKYGDRVAFLVVYSREAHPAGRESLRNQRVGIAIEDPVDFTERLQVACDCAESLPIGLPVLVDGMDDRVTSTYGGRSVAARLIGASGRLAYQSAPNEKVRPPELERAIRRELGWRWWRLWI